jgi:hypothetical protein
MKNTVLIIAIALITIPGISFAQSNNKSNDDGYCIMRVYGAGYVGKGKGIYVIFEDLKIEKIDLKGTSPEETLTAMMETINSIKGKGYKLVTSSISTSGAEFYEYVFHRE